MKILKEISLIILGAFIMYAVIYGNNLSKRIAITERSIQQIVNFLNQPKPVTTEKK